VRAAAGGTLSLAMRIIFIHVPKTGGSSFTNLLRDTFYPETTVLSHFIQKIETPNATIDIRHIHFNHPERLSMSGDIFDPQNYDQYRQCQIYTIVRDPVDRIVSEFNFQKHILKDGPKISRLKPIPATLEEYIERPETWNYQVSFLLGGGILVKNAITQRDYERVACMIEKYPIHLGVTEQYDKFLNKFQKHSHIQLKNSVRVLKKTSDDIKSKTAVTAATRDRIARHNEWDCRLYQYAKSQVETEPVGDGDTAWNWNSDGEFRY
jgi:hypothetical protein